jgi:hypothetical protein
MNTTQPHAFLVGDALRFGWRTTMKNLKPLLIIGGIGAFLSLLHQALTRYGQPGLSWLLALAIEVVQVGVALAMVRVALKLHDGQPVDLERPGALVGDFFTYLLTSVLYGLIVAGGLVLLLVPGVIWGLKYGFAPFAVADEKRDPVEALRESSRLTRGEKGRLFGFALALFGVNLLGVLALGIGLFVTIPTTVIAAAYVFRRLQAHAAAKAEPPVVSGPIHTTPATAH